jgi:multidrug resistance efflux pump
VVLKQYLLHATASGYVKRLHAQIGGEVTIGQKLVDLVDPVLEERQTRLKSELAWLRPSVSGRSPDLQSVLMEQIRLAEGVVAQHRERLLTLQRLFAQGAATGGEVAEARGFVSQAEGDVNRARIELAEEQRRASSPGDWQITSSQDRLRAELDVIAYQRSQPAGGGLLRPRDRCLRGRGRVRHRRGQLMQIQSPRGPRDRGLCRAQARAAAPARERRERHLPRRQRPRCAGLRSALPYPPPSA